MKFGTIILSCTLLCATAQARAAELKNGSFELGVDPGAGVVKLDLGNPVIDDWVIAGAGTGYVGDYWQASDGNRSLRLGGTGTIAQTIATDIGASYLVKFDMSGDPADGLGPRQVVVSIGGLQTALESYELGDGNSLSAMQWETHYYAFTALTNASTLVFAGFGLGSGPALDNVMLFEVDSVESPIPEPLSWALMATGFGLVGGLMRRRGRRQAVGSL